MADPLSTVANVLAVLKLAVAATKYIKDVKQGSTDRLRLRDELRSTTCLLEMLKDRIDDSEDATGDDAEILKPSSIASLAGEEGPLALFKRLLEDIIARLAPQDRLRRLTQPFTWPFDKKDIAELVSALERLKSHFSLAMQNDLVELAKLSRVKLDGIHRHVESARTRSMDKEAEKIVLWVSPLSYRLRHIDVLETAQPGTGTWFLDHYDFKRWTKGEVDVLWCPGIPGAGKTILASMVIDNLEREYNSSGAICTYVYCHYNKRQEQTPVALLSSLLQQILQHSAASTLPAEVLSLYQLHKNHGTRPTLTQITDTLRTLVANFTTFRVIVDALDECSETDDDALRFISAVRSLSPNVKLLCTSRFSSVFENYFSGAKKVEISAHSEDIKTYLASHIQQQSGLARHTRVDASLKDEIIDAIIGESHGMFLLAKLHLESLSKKMTRRAIRAALGALPPTLDATYSEAVIRIYNQAPDLVEAAESVLFWVICVKRPLSVLELRHMYATLELPGDTILEDDDLPDGETLTSTCGGLIMVDGESRSVRLVHYTAQEYFERSHVQALAAARLSLANISLAYLTLPNFSDGPCATDAAMSRRLKLYPFLDYASKHWGEDIGKMSRTEIELLWPRLASFVSNRSALDVASQIQNIPRIRYAHWSQEYPRNVPPLVLAAGFDMPQILRRLLTSGNHPTDSRGSDQVTALIRAAGCGLADNILVLLEHGAKVEARDYMEEATLQKAAWKGVESAVKALIDAGADVNGRSPDWTTLMSAVSSGADLGVETLWGESALTIALRHGREAIATLLADQGATLPRTPAGRRASVIASRKGAHQLVGRLTANYEVVAARPLQRQSSRGAGGLAEIREEAEPQGSTPSNGPSTAQSEPSETEADDEDFLGALEGLSYKIGFEKVYNIGQEIGAGHFAAVHQCLNCVTGVKAAVKIYRMRKWTPELLCFSNELALLQRFREDPHPAILTMIDVFADYGGRRMLVVEELATGGELFHLIVAREKLSEQETRTVFAQLFSAVEFLHDRGWIHRDIKPENILVFDKESLTIKLGDFGLAKQLPADSGLWHYKATLVGTPSYVAPEILVKNEHRKCGTPTDIWSCGVVLYICLCGFPPFSNELKRADFPYDISEQIRGAMFDYPSPYWDPVDDPALDLIDGMLVVDMAKRFTAKQCLEHPWMTTAAPTILEGMGNVRSASPEAVETPLS
ncbi:hypothetical protein C8A00DRAFT_37273 [Chaetomidium leptoderma]|uniref:Protein kinase domain-containing protein n=1 Tax=Chaetomidium leptoderma TaxID=669021 RepID=A0AAN6VFJ5_9PEZI|nr:hypothetical protein C8A00DRAFT_37273 [Chaetomidium leptoderma]